MALRTALGLVVAAALMWGVRALPAGCGWAGDWASEASEQALPMTLYQQSARVSGHYRINRLVDATAAGRTLTGRWSAPPAFGEPANAGRFTIEQSGDCRTFTGTWGFDESAQDGGTWTGVRRAAPDRTAAVRQAYAVALGREPDPAGLSAWARTHLPRQAIEAQLRESAEGQRVAAVRDLYRRLLGRDPLGDDNQGLRAWVDTRLPLDAVLVALRASDEARSRQAQH